MAIVNIKKIIQIGIILGIGALFIFGLGQLDLNNQSNEETQGLPPLAENDIRVLFYFDENNMRVFDGPIVQGMSVFDALRQSAKAGSFDFNYKLDKGRIYVGAINGIRVEKNNTWHFYLNGQEILESLLETEKVKPGDIIEVVYENS
jgi:hypothetical protein